MDVVALAFRDGLVEIAGGDGRVRFYDRGLREVGAEAPTGSLHVWAAAFSADGSHVALADRAGTVRVRGVGGVGESRIETGKIVRAIALGPDALVGVLLPDDEIRLYRDGIVVQTIRGGPDHFGESMAFSPDGKRLALALSNFDAPTPVLRLLDVSQDPPTSVTVGPVGCSCALAFSPDGATVAVAGVSGASPSDPSFVSVLRLADHVVVASYKDARPYCALRTLAFDGRTVVGWTVRGIPAKFSLPGGRKAGEEPKRGR